MIDLNYNNNIFTVEENGIILTVEPTSNATNPRAEEYTTKLLLWGDKDFKGDENFFEDIGEFEKVITDDVIFRKLPVFLDKDTRELSPYLKLNRDWSHIGYIYMTKEKAQQLYGLTSGELSKQARQLCDEKLKDCIKEYNDYVNGRIYCYTITNEDGDILDGGNDYYPQETMRETIEEMTEYCDSNYSYLFNKLLSEMEKSETKKPLKKFMNCNIFDVLGEIMKQNTKHYQSDFEYDKAAFQNAAYAPYSSETHFLWLSRPNGTVCITEREAYVKETYANNSWVFYGEQTNDPIVACAVEIKGIENGRVVGDIYELDYKEHYKRVKENSLPARHVQLTYRHSTKHMDYEPQWGGKIQYDDLIRAVILPADLEDWDNVIKAAQEERHKGLYKEWSLNDLKEHYAPSGKAEMEM